MAWNQPDYKFEGTSDIIDFLREAEPDDRFIEPLDPDEIEPDRLHRARRVTWVGTSGYLVRVLAANVHFMEGNQWNLPLAAARLARIQRGEDTMLEAPAGRVHRVKASDVAMTTKYERAGQLQEQMSMTSPWTRADIGSYHAQLVDGNHRAAAAMAAGEPYIYVYVGENYRENVLKKDWE